ncbi:MAG: DUF1376 domain-containing protein [Pseudaminobacter sp.]
MAKRRLPYMPFWVDDYRRDTLHLSAEEHGAYLLLLMAAWEAPTSSLPEDDHFLAGIAKVSPARWAKMKPVIMAFWHFDGRSKRWVQKRLKKERRLAVDRKQKASDAAASRWNNKKNTNAKPMLEQCHPFITTIEKDKSFSGRAGAQKKSSELKILEAFTDV